MKKVLKETGGVTDTQKILKTTTGMSSTESKGAEHLLDVLRSALENHANKTKLIGALQQDDPAQFITALKQLMTTGEKNLVKEAKRRNANFISYLFESEGHETEEHKREEEEDEKDKEEKHKKALEASKKAAERLISDLKSKKEATKEVITAEDAMKILKRLVQSFNLDEEAVEELQHHLHDLV